MRVLHINCNYIGTELHRVMVRHLNQAPVETIVFTPIMNAGQLKKFRPEANEKISVCFNQIDRLFYFIKQKKIITALRNELKDVSTFDIIHAITLLTDGNVAYKLYRNMKYLM